MEPIDKIYRMGSHIFSEMERTILRYKRRYELKPDIDYVRIWSDIKGEIHTYPIKLINNE